MKAGTTSVQEALERGYSAHRAGRVAEAEQIYNLILQAVPRCFDALHLLGVLKASTGFPEEADRLLKKALMIEPRSPDALNSRANVLQMLGQQEDALACCTRALQAKPDFPEALNNRGNILHDLKRYPEALASLDRAIALRPNYAKALNNRGIVLQDMGRAEEALACFDRALAIESSAETHNNKANALRQLDRLDEALVSVERALRISPQYVKALNNRGVILGGLKRHEEALTSFERAIAIDPRSPEALHGRGAVLRELGRALDALSSVDRALELKPDWPEALALRAYILLSLRRADEALTSSDRALALRPDFIEALNSRGSALRELNRWDEALAHFDRVLALDPEFVAAVYNRAVVLRDAQRPTEALEWIDRALTVQPDWTEALFERANALRDLRKIDAAIATYGEVSRLSPDFKLAPWNESLTRLLGGDFEVGWEKFEHRWAAMRTEWQTRIPNFQMPHAEKPMWHGDEDIAGKTLLLHAEQGFGDTIQFCRYAPLVQARGARVLLEVQPELVRIMGSLAGVDEVTAQGPPAPGFDLHCPLMSLPHAFHTTLSTIPADVPYLAADPELAAMWRTRLGNLGGLKVGLVWAGNPRPHDPSASRDDRRRSTQLAQLAPLASLPEICWISVQKGPPASQAGTPPDGMTLIDWTSDLRDFADTAALVASLDLVISVDTSVAHLAGALGKPVWLLNRFDTCWRWLLEREDTPWYPTMRIFRQPSPGDWESVMQRVAAALPRWIEERGAAAGSPSPGVPVGRAGLVDKVNAGIVAAGS